MTSSKSVMVGAIQIGGGALPVVQSMTNTQTSDVKSTLEQIDRLAQAGCEIVRCAVPSTSALDGFSAVVESSSLPVVADIHFDYKLAIEAAQRGAAKLRINPGNIGSIERVDAVIDAAGEAGIPIRIGVNSGSLSDDILSLDLPLSQKLAISALQFVEHFEDRGFTDIVLSTKGSNVSNTIDAYRLLAQGTDYPLHIGITEAGTAFSGTIKSAVGLGTLLEEGIGDTLRVSLTADPVEEIKVAFEILSALGIRRNRAEVISCPTCGRTQVDLIDLANQVNARIDEIPPELTIAVMGCVVNGPGEAREADYGIACGKGSGVLFAHGEKLRKVDEENLVDELFVEINKR
ncbi:MAG: flavodoxin-dependent (E)-4-hydroxy-3-methylbut-2-enyl-diphosphate synthase [Actinomycetia bacterium]|nr:flavodoxin-dependent (E)-4-hydroxy-3-methylbut-2-enyl-diphosphate synthase [Actinomycetes bacterium]